MANKALVPAVQKEVVFFYEDMITAVVAVIATNPRRMQG